MKRIFYLSLFLALVCAVVLGQPTPGAAPSYGYNSVQALSQITSLPMIRGTWFYVDPYSGDSTAYGKSIGTACRHLDSAYAHCVDGRGDGIVVFSHDSASTTVYTTVNVRKTLRWAKSSITVVGISAPCGYFGRARIAMSEMSTSGVTVTMTAHTVVRATGSFITDGWLAGMTGYCTSSGTSSANNAHTFTVSTVTALTLTFIETFSAQTAAECGTVVLTSYCSPLITVTGENNAFYNLLILNQGSLVCDTGGISIQANRNYMKNVHVIGATSTAAGALAAYQFDLELDASECTFDGCYFGTNSTIWGAANGHIKLGKSTTAIGQDFFNQCHVISYSSTSGAGAIYVTDAATLNGWIQFNQCTFVNWNIGGITTLTKAIIGATPNNTGIFLNDCGMVGWQAWGTGTMFVTTNGASGAGGIGSHL